MLDRVEPGAQPYALRSKIADILTSKASLEVLKPVLPPGTSIDQFIFEAFHAVSQNPEILKCTEQSIVLAVGRAIESGLVIGKTIHLVPTRVKISKRGDPDQYEDRLQAWFDYKGEVELVMRAGVARHIDASAVYGNETFRAEKGTNPNIEHVPILDESARGKMIGGYAYAILPGRILKVITMTLAEVEEIRKNSRQWKHLPAAPAWYVEKTCFHRVCKTLPKNPKLAKVLALFDRQEAEDREEELEGTFEPLNPANEIATSASTATGHAQSEGGDWALSSEDEEDAPFASEPTRTRTPLACELYALPEGLGPKSGQRLGELSTVDLESLYKWARKDNALRRFPDLAKHCEELLEARRTGEAKEPSV